MKKNKPILIASFLIVLLFVLVQLLFIVRQGEVAVITFLGKPTREYIEPGLYPRWPWPLHRIYRFDNRLRAQETSYEETLTQNGENILVQFYAIWRIDQPIRFLKRVGDLKQAESNLDNLVRTHKSAVIGRYPFSDFVNVKREMIKLEEMEKTIQAKVKTIALERYGIEVVRIGLSRLGLPEAITESVFKRMRAERKKLAEAYKSDGEGRAIEIRAKADSEKEKQLAQAQADAKRLRAEGEAKAAEYYKAFSKDPDLAIYLRNLETLEETLKENSTLVISTEHEPFSLLRGVEKK